MSMTNPAKSVLQASKKGKAKRVCFNCLDPWHLISDCKAWKQKKILWVRKCTKSVAFVSAIPESNAASLHSRSSTFSPFVLSWKFSLKEKNKTKKTKLPFTHNLDWTPVLSRLPKQVSRLITTDGYAFKNLNCSISFSHFLRH